MSNTSSSSSSSSSLQVENELNIQISVSAISEPIWLNKTKLNELVLLANNEQRIRNRHLIAELLIDSSSSTSSTSSSTSTSEAVKLYYATPKFLIILVQIHSRVKYLQALIESLRRTEHIEQALVIFSHDVYDEQMNEMIKQIDFCATLQIFYPYSLQLYPNEFPGQDPTDCPKSIKKVDALVKKCKNAANPDAYGNYREHTIVQIKHHWFWKLAFVFEHLNETRHLDHLNVLLLEEDHYLMPDSIHVLRKLTEKILSDIDVVSLAVFERLEQKLEPNQLNQYAKSIWHSSSHNTGILLARPQWQMLKDCLHAFCTYDDYNWDWTLQYIGQTCFKLPLVSIYPVHSRVIHIGDCGTHHKSKQCDPIERVKALISMYDKSKTSYFPAQMKLKSVSTGIHKIKKPNGGWSDPRDHLLCKSFVSSCRQFTQTMLNNSTSRKQ